jgi:hypothetical protein
MLLESQGIRTATINLPDDVSGLTLDVPSAGVLVAVNEVHHFLRRRFSLAHEYAHVLVDRDRAGQISQASERNSLVEVRANTFAAEFLMPEDGVRHFLAGLGKGLPSRLHAKVFDGDDAIDVDARCAPGTQTITIYDVVKVAHYFVVSYISALYRLRNLRVLTEAECEHLKALGDGGRSRQIAKVLGIADPDYEQTGTEFTARFLWLALEAYRRDEISRGKLRELALLVGLSSVDLDVILHGVGLDTGPICSP